MNAGEEIWREAVRRAQDEVSGLSSDFSRLNAASDDVVAAVGRLDQSTVDPDDSSEVCVVRGDRLMSVVQSGVSDISSAVIQATNALDDLRRVLDFYHH